MKIIDFDEVKKIGKDIFKIFYMNKLHSIEQKFILEALLLTINTTEDFRINKITKDVLENKN